MNLCIFLNDPKPRIKQLDMISKPTNIYRCMTVCCTHGIPPTCCGHSCVQLEGAALQRIDTFIYYRSIRTNAQV
jgi:hypothetical protein